MRAKWSRWNELLPLYFAYLTIGLSQVVFFGFVTGQVLGQDHYGIAMRHLCLFGSLGVMSVWSLRIASSTSPGHPSAMRLDEQGDAYGPEDVALLGRDESGLTDEEEATFRGLTREEWRMSKGKADEMSELSSGLKPRSPGEGDQRYGEPIDTSASTQTVSVKSSSGSPRFCRKCRVFKPDRCHHCSSCGICILQMDHHCLWLANCVGYRNRKAFLLFLLYTTLMSLAGGLESLLLLLDFFGSEADPEWNVTEIVPVIWILLTMMGFLFALSLGPFFCFHAYLVARNLTLLEHMRPPFPNVNIADNDTMPGQRTWRPDHLLSRHERQRAKRIVQSINPYDIGVRRNISAVFPPSHKWPWLMHLLPIVAEDKRPGAGETFPVSQDALAQLRSETIRLRQGPQP